MRTTELCPFFTPHPMGSFGNNVPGHGTVVVSLLLLSCWDLGFVYLLLKQMAGPRGSSEFWGDQPGASVWLTSPALPVLTQ
jgi:hypothetical protein